MPRVKAKLVGRVKRAKKHDQGSFVPVEDLTVEQLQNFSGLSLIMATTPWSLQLFGPCDTFWTCASTGANNTPDTDLAQVRIGSADYGYFLFGKVFIPATEKGYFHFRATLKKSVENPMDFKSDVEEVIERIIVDCIHTQTWEAEDGQPKFAAIFDKDDELEFFST